MKKYQILLFLILPLSVFGIKFEDLEVDPRVKQQIADSFALEQSIRQFTESQDGIRPVVTVGGDNACDYRIGTTKIQDVINAHTSVEIRIANNETYNENLVINDNNVSLRGGYANCSEAANDIISPWRTSIRGITGAKNPVIKIVGNTQRSTIVLERLSLSNGEGGAENFPGGGISTYQADAQIKISNTVILNNTGRRGGGIAIIGGNTDISATDLDLHLNTARFAGGGLYCDGSDASLTMHGFFGRVFSNKADGTGGGGVYTSNGCSFMMYSAVFPSPSFFRPGINNNSSVSDGGGIKATTGSLVTLFGHEVCLLSGVCFGTDTKPVSLSKNRVIEGSRIGDGGGASVNGSNTVLNIYAGRVIGNKALSGSGGAISIKDGATFITKRLSKACWSQRYCNHYAANVTTSEYGVDSFGGAIDCRSSTVSITNTVFRYNRAGLGTVMALGNCATTIRSSLMYQNGNYGGAFGGFQDDYVIFVSSGTLDIHHTNIVDNKSNLAVLDSTNNADVEIIASIIHNASSTGPILSENSTGVDVECSILHEDASVTSQALTIVDDPNFIDRANRNYRLNPQTSPAVDYCYANTGDYRDMDFQERGWDDPSINNIYGPYDVGAYEVYGVPAFMFSNSFE